MGAHRSPNLRALFVSDRAAGAGIINDPFVLAPDVDAVVGNFSLVQEVSLLAGLRRTINPAERGVSKFIFERAEVGFKRYNADSLAAYLKFAESLDMIADLKLDVSGDGRIREHFGIVNVQSKYDVVVCIPPCGKRAAWVPSSLYRLLFPQTASWLVFRRNGGGDLGPVGDLLESETFEQEALAVLWHFGV